MKGDGILQYSVKKGLHHLAHKMLGTTPRKKCFRTLKEPADEKHSSLERYLLLVFFVVFLFFVYIKSATSIGISSTLVL